MMSKAHGSIAKMVASFLRCFFIKDRGRVRWSGSPLCKQKDDNCCTLRPSQLKFNPDQRSLKIRDIRPGCYLTVIFGVWVSDHFFLASSPANRPRWAEGHDVSQWGGVERRLRRSSSIFQGRNGDKSSNGIPLFSAQAIRKSLTQ